MVTVHVTAIPTTVTVAIAEPERVATVTEISLTGLAPPTAVPKILRVLPTAKFVPPDATVTVYTALFRVTLKVGLPDPDPVTTEALTAEYDPVVVLHFNPLFSCDQ